MAKNYTQSASNDDDFALVLTDNGAGGLLYGSRSIGGSVDYGTGAVVIDAVTLLGSLKQPQYSNYQITRDASSTGVALQYKTTQDVHITAASARVASITSADVREVSQTIATGLQTYDVLNGKAYPRAVLFNSWVFEINGERIIERNGTLYRNWNTATGAGEAVGSLSVAGKATFNALALDKNAVIKVLQGVMVNGTHEVQSYVGRTAIAPIKPQSFTAYAEVGGNTLTGVAQADETLAGSLKGKVDSETGFFSIEASEPIAPDALRYNAVSQSTVPLDSSIIGINATRLPLDGKVPIFRAGGLVVIHNSISQDIGSAFTAGQTVQLNRQNLDRLCVKDAAGAHIDAEKYDYDLAAGTLTWRTPLDLQGYTMPLTAVQFWEEDNRVVETNISGSLKLQNPLTRDFPKEGTFVSSAVVAGDLLVRASEPFSQKAWTGVWQNTRIGDALLAKTNVKDYPIAISADGAINERWLLKFTSNTQFELYGESLGLIATGDILSDLAPINPATNQPYFRLPAAAFGGGWAAQNCIRFNTTGTPIPLWIVRAIQPTGKRSTHKDGWTVCLRGDTIEV